MSNLISFVQTKAVRSKSKTGRAFEKVRPVSPKNCWWLAYPLLPANGLSVALQLQQQQVQRQHMQASNVMNITRKTIRPGYSTVKRMVLQGRDLPFTPSGTVPAVAKKELFNVDLPLNSNYKCFPQSMCGTPGA
jgi:hypothetical protein